LQSAASNLLQTLWRLIPGNPIMVRVVYGQSRRIRHLWLRIGYLVVLFIVMLAVVIGKITGAGASTSLNDLAKAYSDVFETVAYVQLGLMCFLAPVFTAAAITQERDAQTFNILLTTPMSNAQIVLGSLCSRLYFVIMLLMSGVPIFCITMIYGGVTLPVIFRSFAIAGATAVITGSIAITYSVMRVGTKRTIFTFYFLIGIYLLSVYSIGQHAALRVADAAPNADGQRMSWLAWCHPFLALDVALNRVPAADVSAVARFGWPTKYLLAYPDYSYVVIMLLLSAVLVTFGMLFVRRGAKEGETTAVSRVKDRLRGLIRKQSRRAPRSVWKNPIAWREAATQTSMAGSSAVRYVYFVLGVVAAIVLLGASLTGAFGLTPAETQYWLVGLVLVEFGIVLLIATNMAASAVTRDRESQTMEILLCTPLTPKDLIWGKLRGLVSFTIPLIGVPVVTCFIFAVAGLFQKHDPPIILPESVIYMPVLMVVYAALACVLGLQRSIRCTKTVTATLSSVGILVLVCFASIGCLTGVLPTSETVGAMLAPFTPFTSVAVSIAPAHHLGLETAAGGPNRSQLAQARFLCLIGSAAAAVIYILVVVGLYKSMVRNFDMTVRKQSV
jgi:ABC-type transport system involved in multi-copper enzyme maturation permease subunit